MQLDIDKERKRSMNVNLRHETVEVEIIKPSYKNGSMKFMIDDRLVKHWIHNLILWGDEFKMLNKVTGAMIWSKNLKGSLDDLTQMMDLKT